MFRRWLSGHSSEFVISPALSERGARYRDRGASAATYWIAFAVTQISLGIYFRQDLFTNLSDVVWFCVILIVLSYRGIRVLARTSELVFDVQRGSVEIHETWPTSRHASSQISHAVLLMQPVNIAGMRGYSWSGYALLIRVENETFTIGVQKRALSLRPAIRSLNGIALELVRDTIHARLPM